MWSCRVYERDLPILLLNLLDLIKFYMNEKDNCNSKKKRKIEVSQDKSRIDLFLFNPNLGYDENEFNKRAEKSDNDLDILPLNVDKWHDLEHFLGRKTILTLPWSAWWISIQGIEQGVSSWTVRCEPIQLRISH